VFTAAFEKKQTPYFDACTNSSSSGKTWCKSFSKIFAIFGSELQA
jgi:hypothetical protein